MFRTIVDYFIFSSLYIAICAVLMVWQTTWLLLGVAPPGRLLGFVFFATICSYNFHWYLTPKGIGPSHRVQWTHRHKALHFILYLVGIVGSAVYFFYLSHFFIALCIAAFLTFLYSAPKLPWRTFQLLQKIAVGKTLFLTFVWVYVTTVLPLIVTGTPWHPSFYWFTASRLFLIYGICIIFDYRDRQDDRTEGIRSLITLLSERGIDWLFGTAMGGFFLSTLVLAFYRFPAYYVFLLLIPGGITSALYREAKRNFSDDLYYIVLDGLMMFSGLLMFIFRI
ncbi:MAG TPA: UbiA family prenyltransferase [Puia sp.]|uniref:UbiA family prenyltransferase n=1 Tax=Puia sp. TaxID=2045100 RepID=UPI002BD74C25|nr:UbiA family prenyltransferase [Puia sp.]HVU96587.1 UbiA family prenyltransferase [Puia sp.]